MYHFSVCVIVSDGSTENNSLFDRLSTLSTENMLPSDLKSKFKDVNFEYKCVRKHPMSHDLIFLIADMPHLVKKIVNKMVIIHSPIFNAAWYFKSKLSILSSITSITLARIATSKTTSNILPFLVSAS